MENKCCELFRSIKNTAMAVYRTRLPIDTAAPAFSRLTYSDPVFSQAYAECKRVRPAAPGLVEFIHQTLAHPDFYLLADRPDKLDPMIMTTNGGMRLSGFHIVFSVFGAAFRNIYLLGLPDNEDSYVAAVIHGFEELRKALAGQPVKGLKIAGLAKISLAPGTELNTPWGLIKPAPGVQNNHYIPEFGFPVAEALLVTPEPVQVMFDRAASLASINTSPSDTDISAAFLFPLSFAIASKDENCPAVPVTILRTQLLPFIASFGLAMPIVGPVLGPSVNIDNSLENYNHWANLIFNNHSHQLDIAAKRLVSAVAHRLEKADSLIDAVMAWENMFGTEQEVSFRVSAALAKLMSKSPQERRNLQKTLSDAYGIRSRLVHGAQVDPRKVEQACSTAISAGVLALRQIYSLGLDWTSMSSVSRSNEILLS